MICRICGKFCKFGSTFWRFSIGKCSDVCGGGTAPFVCLAASTALTNFHPKGFPSVTNFFTFFIFTVKIAVGNWLSYKPEHFMVVVAKYVIESARATAPSKYPVEIVGQNNITYQMTTTQFNFRTFVLIPSRASGSKIQTFGQGIKASWVMVCSWNVDRIRIRLA